MRRIAAITVRKRLTAVFLLIAVYFIIMVCRLAYVQLISADEIIEKAEELWSRDIPLYAERGKILDRNGEVLVDNQLAPSLAVVPRQIDNPESVAEKLTDIIPISKEDALDHLTKVAAVEIIHPEGRKLSEEQAEQIRMLNEPGIYLAQDSKRSYPHGEQLAHVLGFTGIDNQGLMGLELSYDDELSGEQGALSFFSDAKGRRLSQLSNRYKPPEDGNHLSLTIDAEIQSIVERELDIAEAKYNPDGALAIVMDPDNGKVLAMASRPNFHPAEYQSVSPEIYNRNLPVFSTYEPGSTFKIITLASALEEKLVDLDQDTYYDDGDIKVGGATLHCWSSGGHGSQTYLEVAENSCNPGFVSLGQMLGEERLFTYIEEFGFGEKTGIDLQGESKGIMFQEEQIGPVELATTSFGQGVSVTPIQQITAVSAAINGGYLYEPQIVNGLVDPVTGEKIKDVEPVMKERVISQETSEEVRRALESVVAKGTGRGAYVDGYRVGGKTGTAQKVGPDGRYLENNHIVSFMGFAPADDPEYVVYVAIDNPKETVQFGGVVTAPIVGTIIGDTLRAKDVPKREGGLEKEYQWTDVPMVEVPDLIGESKNNLRHYLNNLSLDVQGDGDTVISQSPKRGEKVESGSTIRVYLGDSD
ncbi:stage V sporulation protein D [Tenuibacillus multivorans]|uniref:serine-type D-Ala-D-Ala carboxypeptidase n=1 Tax=Tenuibacillus multivorans TaxID=237069 RepID=A0A1G9Y6M9_9BACI|nr:stage V sporulation protein D [Tenuibacillus multivorans]GEL75971.1 stage V sporulation protein D [Tenuibacillus multivorans]SDN04792.1 stage V sporulation protein D (sporulation-specific penicillin-binding protein) [Tenuibacillus multivorans]